MRTYVTQKQVPLREYRFFDANYRLFSERFDQHTRWRHHSPPNFNIIIVHCDILTSLALLGVREHQAFEQANYFSCVIVWINNSDVYMRLLQFVMFTYEAESTKYFTKDTHKEDRAFKAYIHGEDRTRMVFIVHTRVRSLSTEFLLFINSSSVPARHHFIFLVQVSILKRKSPTKANYGINFVYRRDFIVDAIKEGLFPQITVLNTLWKKSSESPHWKQETLMI